jgi:DNA-binding protein HU-beta
MADLNRRDLVRYMAKEVDGLSQQMAAASLDAAIAYITQTLASHQSLIIQDFGKFGVRYRAARQGCHPASHLPIEIEATAIAYFTPSPKLKLLVKANSTITKTN